VGRHFPPSRRTATLPWQYRLGRYAAVIFVLASVAVGGWLLREPVLVGAADLWIVSDSITRADAIVVLGGGVETRPYVAAELRRRGFADKILISHGSEERAAGTGDIALHSELNREKLLKLGVPVGSIETFGTQHHRRPELSEVAVSRDEGELLTVPMPRARKQKHQDMKQSPSGSGRSGMPLRCS
jgi:hypothetical protein